MNFPSLLFKASIILTPKLAKDGTKNKTLWTNNFPESPMVKSSLFSNAEGAGSIPGQEAKIPHASGTKKAKHKTEAIL